MKVTIITVCYNSSKTIEKTILSVINQSYNNIEYIIIDGKSIDNTLSVIKLYDNYITKFISESDSGLYDAMNKAISISTGDIIGILNSDDVFYSNTTIEEVVYFHTMNLIDASVGNIVQHNIDGKIVRKYSSKYWNPHRLRYGYMPPHPSIFLKRELFSNYGSYSTNFEIAADYELICRFFLLHSLKWKYSNITTTRMAIGGLSSSGLYSYKKVTSEIKKALSMNNLKFIPFFISFRFVWKIFGLLNYEK
jgi:glycosyltransferase involved in cell wall biosynthesis